MYKKKLAPICEKFKEAVKFITEWRDTLLVVGVAGFTCLNASADNAYLSKELSRDLIFYAPVAREFIRGLSWHMTPESVHIDVPVKREKTHFQCVQAAEGMLFTTLVASDIAEAMLVGPNGVHALAFGVVGSFAYSSIRKVGGPREFLETCAYIWDWPRKRDGDGGQTERLTTWFRRKIFRFRQPAAMPG